MVSCHNDKLIENTIIIITRRKIYPMNEHILVGINTEKCEPFSKQHSCITAFIYQDVS